MNRNVTKIEIPKSEMTFILSEKAILIRKINFLFDSYKKEPCFIKDVDDICLELLDNFYENICENTCLTQSQAVDFISEVKASAYSRMARLYRKELKEKGMIQYTLIKE